MMKTIYMGHSKHKWNGNASKEKICVGYDMQTIQGDMLESSLIFPIQLRSLYLGLDYA